MKCMHAFRVEGATVQVRVYQSSEPAQKFTGKLAPKITC